jgi:hypothetical protein
MSTRSQNNKVTSPRGVSYGGRSAEQKRTYIETVVEGSGPSSTAPTPFETPGAATDSPLPQEDDNGSRRPSRRPSKRIKTTFVERNRNEIEKVILVLLVAFIGAAIAYALSNNREIGEIQQSLRSVNRELDQVGTRVTRVEERTDHQFNQQATALERIRASLDELRGRLFGSPPPKKL